MTTMLERAARAIYDRKYADNDPWDEATARMERLGMNRLSNNQAEAMADARAALVAIREPGDAMLSAVESLSVINETGEPGTDGYLALMDFPDDAEAFTAMIDAILSEEPA